MASPQTVQRLQRIEQMVWVLIYGGLLTLVLGIATTRTVDGATGVVLMVVGGVAAAAGVALIAVRARLSAAAER